MGMWLLAFVAFAVSIRSTRKSLLSLCNAIFRRQILIPLFLMLTYIDVMVLVLYETGVWTTNHLKNTVLWTFSVAILSMFRIPQHTEDDTYFRTALKDNFKIIVVLEFIVAFYTFSVFTELLIVPAVTLLIALQTFSDVDQRYKHAGQLVAMILTTIGCGLMLYAVLMLATEPSSFFKAGTLSDFVLPIVLTILFLPFLFVLNLYMQYEVLFTRIKFLYQTGAERRRARRTALFGLHIRTPLLKRWIRYIQRHRPRDTAEFRKSVNYVKAQVRNEQNPPHVPICRGWSPYLASKFLSEMDLGTGDYVQDGLGPDKWYSCSAYLGFNGELMSNNIAFYVEGDKHSATTLKLVANVNDIRSVQTLRIRFLKAIETLIAEALKCSVPPQFMTAVNDERSLSLTVSGKMIDFVKECWPGQCGYELRFCLSNESIVETGVNSP